MTRHLVLASFLVVAGCRLVAAPDPGGGLGPVATVRAPVVDDEIGTLHPADSGLWAFRINEGELGANLERGSIAVFHAPETKSRHLYAVVRVEEWGVWLQRLDVDPVGRNEEGHLVGLGDPRKVAAQWNFCIGEGSPSDAACLREAAPGTRWYVYALERPGKVALPDRERDRSEKPFLPVELAAVVAVGSLGVDAFVSTSKAPKHWVAVPGPVAQRPTRPRIAASPSCKAIVGSDDALDASWIYVEHEVGDHPIEVESAAWELAVDAFVDCDGTQATIRVPGLYRSGVEVPGREFSAPTFLAAEPVTVPGDTASMLPAVRAAAAIATGDLVTADFFVERFARQAKRTAAADRFLALTMVAVAASGRPEIGVASGSWGVRGEWNKSNSAPWVWGMAVAEEALQARKQALVRTHDLPDLIDRSGIEAHRAFFAYHRTVGDFGRRDSVGDLIEGLKAYPKFAFAARAEFARRNSAPKLDALSGEFAKFGVAPLLDAMTGSNVALACAGECAGDVYGRLWSGGSVAPEALSRVGEGALRPGYRAPKLGDDAWTTLRATLAVYPLLDGLERKAAVETATTAAIRWVAAGCKSAGPDTLAGLRRLGVDAALRMEDWELLPLDATMAWLTIRGVPGACESPEVLAARATEFAGRIGASTVPAELLAIWVERSSGAELQRVLPIAADYAASFERGQRCADWNLALATHAARDGRFDDARQRMTSTDSCRVTDRVDMELLNAYLNFQQTGQISTDYGEQVQSRLARVVHHYAAEPRACLGAGQLDYHILPELSEGVAELVVRLPPSKGKRPDDELSVVQASDRLSLATEALADVRTNALASNWVEAAAELVSARQNFASLGHEVGLARARFVDEVMFGGAAVAVAERAKDPTEAVPAGLTKRKATYESWLASKTGDHRVVLADAILRGDEAQVRAVSERKAADSGLVAFCRSPDRKPEGTVLDRQSGVLQPVSAPEAADAESGDDDPPEGEDTSPSVDGERD